MICIISSAGGHLTEVQKATTLLNKQEKFYVTFSLPHIKESLVNEECYFVVDPHLNPFKYILNFFQSLAIYIKKRPKVIITTGAGIAIPMCVIGKCAGTKVIFIESGARVNKPSRTGRLLYPIADLFIVQWDSLLKYFPKAICGGVLL
ncbi:PssD/Cps14F family polysaccharide biosynthesis glycosyltransferase [Candidatus Omnitrophota bacterium]